MTFGEKLSFLIKHFNSSNSKLAKAISIDPSLVSKWVNGRRIPPLNSSYIIQIADYFVRIPASEYQQASLWELLKVELADQNSPRDTHRALIEWLTSTISPLHDPDETDSIAHITANSQASLIEPMGASGQQCYYDFFGGRSGRRQAVINFLSAVLDASEPGELLLASQEDTNWILEDAEFLSQWAFMLKEVLSRGHRITIIHTVNRDISQISSMINHWLPLHLTGKIESYYHPKYEEHTLVKTIFVARGIAAILSIVPARVSDAEYTFMFRDEVVVGLLEQNFRSYLKECRPLVRAFAGNKRLQLHHEVIDTWTKPGYFYTLSNGLNLLTMSIQQFSRLVERSSLTAKEKRERIQLHQLGSEAFLETIKYNRVRELCPIEAINLHVGDNTDIYPGCEWFMPESVKLETKDWLEHLSNIIGLLENNDNYELILYNNQSPLLPANISMSLKEDYYAIISSLDTINKTPYALLTSEGNILQAFEDYFENIYAQIPAKNRNKTWVINKLKSRK